MAVNLSPVGGVAAQFFSNNGVPLTGGKLYTYAAGTTTPQATYTTSAGNVFHSNPIVLDSAGRVPNSGEIWLTDGLNYKFLLKDSNDVLIATYDNISGINSNFIAFTNQQEIQTATAGQTVFNLGINYQPGTNSLSVFVDGVNQYGPGAMYSYVETDSVTVTFNTGLHVGAEVKFTTTQQQGAGIVDAQQVSYAPPFTNSVATNVEAKLAQTVSVLDFGADPTGVADSTTAFQNALDASLSVYAPAGTYVLSAINLNQSGHTLKTDGFATIFQQKSDSGVGVRMINVQASNVTIESCSTKGNIATDTDEQNHSIFIQSNVTYGNLSNITIGDVYGQDVRGDVLYIGATTGYLTSYVTFGRITGSNILRNVVSIVGGAYITGDAAISSGATGLWALDVEPNTVICHDIHVEMVRGAAMGCVPPTAAYAAYNISIGTADLNPAYAPNTTPPYASRNVRSALTLRNTKSFQIGYLKAKDHTHFALEYIWNGGEQRGQGIEIGYLDVNNVGSGEATYNAALLITAVDYITILGANVILNDTVADSMLLGDTSGATFTRAIVEKAVVNGRVARYIQQGRFSNIVAATTSATSAFNRIDDCTILDSIITVPTLISFANRCTFINVTATCSTAYYGSTVADTTRINCNFGGTITGLATQRAAAASLTGEIAYGSTTATTVGAAGGATALPATPTGYIIVNIAGTDRKIPFYAS